MMQRMIRVGERLMKTEKDSNMIGYFITQYQMSGIHAGIQAAHCAHVMSSKYAHESNQHDQFHNWSRDHQTMVVLNGGGQSQLKVIYDLIDAMASDHGLPYAKFHESYEAANGLLTCVGVILPRNAKEIVQEADYIQGIYYLRSIPKENLGIWRVASAIANLPLAC